MRELENVIERAVILGQGDDIEAEDLDFGLRLRNMSSPLPSSGDSDLPSQLEDMERRRLVETLAKHRGRKADVARELGINRSTLYYRLKKLGIEEAPGE